MEQTPGIDRVAPAARRRLQEERLRGLVRFAYEQAPALKERMDRAGLAPRHIRTIKDLEKMPIMRKEDIIALQQQAPPFGGLCARPLAELDRVLISPGPVFEPLAQTEGGIKALEVAGFGRGDVCLLTPSFHMVPAGMLYDAALRRVGATVVPTGPGNTELQIQVLRHLGVTGYVGFPRFLLNIIRRAEELGYDFRRDFRLSKAFVGGEMFPPSLRRTVEGYGVATWEHYGTADLGVVAYECPRKDGLHLFEGVIVEVVDPQTGKQLPPGESGEIVVTTFSREYPLVRYGTGDAAYYTEEPCPCGRTIPRLVDILGRVGDAPRVRGLFLVPKEVVEAVSVLPGVEAFQLSIRLSGLRDELTLRVEGVEGVVGEPAKFTRAVQSRFKDICRLDLDRVELVPRGTIPQGSKVILDERKWE